MTLALFFSLDTCHVQIQSVQVDFACTKGIFNLSAEAIINARNARLCQIRKIPFEDQGNSYFLSLGQGVDIFEENPKSVQDVTGDVYSPGKFCSNREKCESLGGYVTTARTTPKNSSRCYWRCAFSWQILFQRREMRISWWLCNNSANDSQKQFKMLSEMCTLLASFVPTERNGNLLVAL